MPSKFVEIVSPSYRLSMSAGLGVPATIATTAEEFYSQFEEAMATKGPHLISEPSAQLKKAFRLAVIVRPEFAADNPFVGLILPTRHFSALAVEEIPSCHCWKAGSVSGQIVTVTRVHKNLCKIIGGLRVADP